MKAEEVLRRYEKGERDFTGENLRGQSFKGKDLSGADFSEADIRGANFTNATLTGAKFVGAKAGLQRRWAVSLVLASWLLAAIAGFFALFMSATVVSLIGNDLIEYVISGWISLITLVIFYLVTIRKGTLAGFGFLAGAFAVAAAGAFAVVGAFAVAEAVAGSEAGAVVVAAAEAETVAGTVPGALGIVGALAFAETVAVVLAFAVAGALTVAFAVAGAVAGALALALTVVLAGAFAGSVAVVLAGAFIIFSLYISWRALKGDPRDVWIPVAAMAFAATGGTSFRGANLTDADFTNATLKSTDFRKANLTRTCWKDAIKLDRVRPGETYLRQPPIRELVLTGNGENLNCDRLNLQGVNFQGANLQNTSFIETNLNDANLQDADLTDARLVHAQLDGADLTGATLTGAYIEEWNITTTTKLDGIRCDYVFMRLPPKERPAFIALPPKESSKKNHQRRKPDDWNKNFEDGEFSDFIAPMRETLDLYHNQSVDMRLVAIALQQLKDDNPEAELEVVSMEKKGKNKDKLLIRAETSPQSDVAALNRDYFSNLESVQSLPPEALQALLAERGRMIQLLTGVLETKHQNTDTNININNQNQGDSKMSGDRNIKTNSYREDNRDMSGNKGQINENVGRDANQYTSEQKQDLATAAADIQKLLEQLEKTYPTDTTTGKMTVATKALEKIENDPTMMRRILSALKSGGTAALEELLSHPAASFAIAALEDWQKSKKD